MATFVVPGQRRWGLSRDTDGHREYKITFMVRGLPTDGPARVLATPGLPTVGSTWSFDGDIDLWAWCRPEVTVVSVLQDEPNTHWTLEYTYSTKPYRRCQDTPIENPLLEPMKVSGGWTKFNEEATHDRFGDPIWNSAREQMRGQHVEFERNRPTVKIQQNVSTPEINVFSLLLDTVNNAPLWGLPRGAIRFSGAGWERKYYGQCFTYYSRDLEFDIRNIRKSDGSIENHDRNLLDEGTKVLRGDWDRNEASPSFGLYLVERGLDLSDPGSYIKFKDWNGENARVILDGHGTPYIPPPDGGWSRATAVTVAAGGGGYNVGDVITIDGRYSTPATVLVAEVLAGVVQEVLLLPAGAGGVYQFFSGNPVATTGGTGTGCTLNVTWDTVTTPGNIHVEFYPEGNFLLLGIPLVL